MDERALQQLLEGQIRYYRARAETYDLDMAWDSDDPELQAELAPVYDWFADVPIRGQVLELACGTGAWTRRLAARAEQVHAVDVAPEMIQRAEQRLGGALGNVTFEVADVYGWEPRVAYDTVFFSFLLTHVPAEMTSGFWQVVSSSLGDHGTVAFVDAAPHRQDEEEWLEEGVVERTLRDGSQHRIVKVFPTPEDVVGSMAEQSIDATVEVISDAFLVGVGRHSTSVV